MDEIWLSLEEACHLKGCKPWWVRALARRGELKKRLAENRTKNGKCEMEYALSSFSADEQLRYAASRAQALPSPSGGEAGGQKSLLGGSSTDLATRIATAHPASRADRDSGGRACQLSPLPETLPLFSEPLRVAPEERAALPEDLRPQADERLAIISPLLEFRERASGSTPLVRTSDGREVRSLNELAEWLAKQHGITARTIWRWYSLHKHKGYAALADQARRDRGLSRIFGRPPERIPDDPAELAAELLKLTPAGRRLAHLYLNEHKSYLHCHQVLQIEYPSLNLAAAPSYGAVRAFLDTFPIAFRHLRSSEKEFHDHCAPYVLRDYTTLAVLDGWVLDHAQDDFFVRNDYIESLDRLAFPELPLDAKLRMWLTAFEDIRSRYILGYAFSVHPSSTAICSALRMAVLRVGRPPKFGLLDRGEDMKKMGLIKAGEPLAHAGAFARLIHECWGTEQGNGNGIIFSIGEHPQSKPIESWFKTKRNQFDSQVISYCSNKPENRPETCNLLLAQHARALKRSEQSPLPAASTAIAATAYWIERCYNQSHRHSGHGMGRRTPEQVLRAHWSAEQEAIARKQLNPRALDELLWDRQIRKVSNECVQMYNAQYEPADDYSCGSLRAWNGMEVLVAADPHNLGDAIAINPQTGKFIAALQSKQLLAWGASQDMIRAKMREQRRARKAVENYNAMLAAWAGGQAGAFDFLGPGFAEVAPITTEKKLLLAAPGGLAPRPPADLSSPFVDDAVAAFNEAMKEAG